MRRWTDILHLCGLSPFPVLASACAILGVLLSLLPVCSDYAYLVFPPARFLAWGAFTHDGFVPLAVNLRYRLFGTPSCKHVRPLHWNLWRIGSPHFDDATGHCDCHGHCGPELCPASAPDEQEWGSSYCTLGTACPDRSPRVTFVTSLVDVGREHRSYCSYLWEMSALLSSNINLVIFAERSGYAWIMRARRELGFASRTHIYLIDGLEDVPFYELLPRMQRAIMSSWHLHSAHGFRAGKPEHKIPEYGWINHAKSGFMLRAIEANPFGSDYFFWIDAGAGHGRSNQRFFWKNWCPCTACLPHKVTLFSESLNHSVRMTAEEYWNVYVMQGGWYKEHFYFVAGAFWGGGAKAVREFARLYRELIDEMLDLGIMDDDMPWMNILATRRPDLVRVLPGDNHNFHRAC
eukprot:gnl/TRDRNA2_/TRDRNA2_127211_c0_seq2.p1 gnl/TRDRNA2_/TRDRNA2_127211_c0~~gnl/TRDRNA2_/TRDRNA2_127211_c0_seq2.p1  ORF type:complete len:405 (-),score=36.68 gnl/TRDRNA2_/TRDRNA2_127211_c0_seq2:51-1265(-)